MNIINRGEMMIPKDGGHYLKNDDIVQGDGRTIKIIKLQYPSLSTVSTAIHSFEFPLNSDGTLNEDASRKKYADYSQYWLEIAISDAHLQIEKDKDDQEHSMLEQTVLTRMRGKSRKSKTHDENLKDMIV